MKTLYLIRHAKSDWDNSLITDLERPLSERGYTNAGLMSRLLNDKKIMPDSIISSPAIRAISTALIFSKNLNYDPNQISIKRELYDTSVKHYLSVIKSIDDTHESAMLFGHNPIISDTVDALIKALPMEFPTCAIAGIHFTVNSWNEIKNKSGELFLFDYPKHHC